MVRRAETDEPFLVPVRHQDLDRDLIGLPESDLIVILLNIIEAVTIHYSIGDGKRTAKDDRELMRVLPESPTMDQRVPDDLYENCVVHIDTHLDVFSVYPEGPFSELSSS